jgi:hypothetical protein
MGGRCGGADSVCIYLVIPPAIQCPFRSLSIAPLASSRTSSFSQEQRLGGRRLGRRGGRAGGGHEPHIPQRLQQVPRHPAGRAAGAGSCGDGPGRVGGAVPAAQRVDPNDTRFEVLECPSHPPFSHITTGKEWCLVANGARCGGVDSPRLPDGTREVPARAWRGRAGGAEGPGCRVPQGGRLRGDCLARAAD